MAGDSIDVKYVAQLARIELGPEEEGALQAQLNQVLGYVEKLNEVNVEGVEPMAHAVPLINVMRADQPGASLSHEAALENAPASVNGLFKVPKIVE